MLKALARALLWWSSTAWLGRLLAASLFHSAPSTLLKEACTQTRHRSKTIFRAK
jgi:hypothetical protein